MLKMHQMKIAEDQLHTDNGLDPNITPEKMVNGGFNEVVGSDSTNEATNQKPKQITKEETAITKSPESKQYHSISLNREERRRKTSEAKVIIPNS